MTRLLATREEQEKKKCSMLGNGKRLFWEEEKEKNVQGFDAINRTEAA